MCPSLFVNLVNPLLSGHAINNYTQLYKGTSNHWSLAYSKFNVNILFKIQCKYAI